MSLRAAVEHRGGVHRAAVSGHGGARLLSVPGHAQQRSVRRRGGSRRPAARARGRAGAPPLRRRGAARDLARTARRTSWSFLLQQFALSEQDLYQVTGPVNLNRLSAIYDLVERTDLKFPPFAPALLDSTTGAPDLFEQLRESRPAAASSFPELRAGDGFPARRRRRIRRCSRSSRRCIAPARLADRRCAGGRLAQRQGRHRHHRTARALRRGSQHRPCRTGCRKPACTWCTAWSATRRTPR